MPEEITPEQIASINETVEGLFTQFMPREGDTFTEQTDLYYRHLLNARVRGLTYAQLQAAIVQRPTSPEPGQYEFTYEPTGETLAIPTPAYPTRFGEAGYYLDQVQHTLLQAIESRLWPTADIRTLGNIVAGRTGAVVGGSLVDFPTVAPEEGGENPSPLRDAAGGDPEPDDDYVCNCNSCRNGSSSASTGDDRDGSDIVQVRNRPDDRRTTKARRLP